MAEQDGFKLFGFEIKRASAENPVTAPSIVPARDEDGAGYVTVSGSHYGNDGLICISCKLWLVRMDNPRNLLR